MRRVLRVITGGPNEPRVFVDRRLTIGRAADSDVQLADPEVSRRHAKIELDPTGVVILSDLASTIGTIVDGARIDRIVLSPGAEIEIGRTRLRYEEVREQIAERRPPATRGMDVLRPTMRIELDAPPKPRRRPPPPPERNGEARAGAATMRAAAPTRMRRDDTSRIVVPHAPRLAAAAIPHAPRAALTFDAPSAAPVLSGVPSLVEDDAVPLVEPDPMVVRADTMSVVRAVFEYRRLRLQQLRHEILDHEELARLDELAQQLEQQSQGRGEGRRFRRFGCAVPAWLVRLDDRRIATAPIALEDISAGGAQLCITDEIAAGNNCWLVVDLEDDSADPVIVFGARVVWSLPDDHRLGLVFSGGVRSGADGTMLVRAEAGLD